jgi:hypothetical protein
VLCIPASGKYIRVFGLRFWNKLYLKIPVDELVLTGHGLGAVLCYLVALDLMDGSGTVSGIQLPLKLVLFGCPRVGSSSLVHRWCTIVADRIFRGFPVSKFSTKGHNDGQACIHLTDFANAFIPSQVYRHFHPTPWAIGTSPKRCYIPLSAVSTTYLPPSPSTRHFRLKQMTLTHRMSSIRAAVTCTTTVGTYNDGYYCPSRTSQHKKVDG